MSVFFVLHGLLNGEAGNRAVRAGGGEDSPMVDGWYYLAGDDTDGEGPYSSRDEAEEAEQQSDDSVHLVQISGSAYLVKRGRLVVGEITKMEPGRWALSDQNEAVVDVGSLGKLQLAALQADW